MKLKSILTASSLALGLVLGLSAQEVSLPGSAAPAAAAGPKFTEAQLLETFGWFIGKRIGLTELKFTPEQTDAVVKGLLAAAGGKDSPHDLEQIGPQMDEFMQRKQEQYLSEVKQQATAEASKFFAELKQKPNVQSTSSGLHYEIVAAGEGAEPKTTDTVKVHYTGRLIDGTVFDSSVQRGEPIEIPLDGVIPGWTEGLQKLKKGGKMVLYIPASLAYGDSNQPGIPPGSTLIFDVELLDIKPPAAR